MRTQTKELQEHLTPKDAHRILVEGNKRFAQNVRALRNLQSQVLETSTGQYPFAAILSCIDSRVPAELVFDQGIGDIFSIRVAGNVINEDVLGSMEFACKVTGSKIVVVMGHTKCGAVAAACNDVQLGNITSLLHKIKPAVASVQEQHASSENSHIVLSSSEIVEKAIVQNVLLSIDTIRAKSPILAKMEQDGEIEIVGAVYSISTGEVTFLGDEEAYS